MVEGIQMKDLYPCKEMFEVHDCIWHKTMYMKPMNC